MKKRKIYYRIIKHEIEDFKEDVRQELHESGKIYEFLWSNEEKRYMWHV